jgi:hypothetical protein
VSQARRAGLALMILALAVIPRLADPARFFTWDEFRWTHGMARFLMSVQAGQWAGTYYIGDPGVMTLWLDSAAAVVRSATTPTAAADLAAIAARDQYEESDQDFLAKAAPFVLAARPLFGLANAVLVLMIYLALSRLVDWPVAAWAGVLIALDPFHVAHSRVVHADALVAGLTTLSLLLALIHLTEASGSRGERPTAPAWLILSGITAGLATANKSPAAAVALVILSMLLWVGSQRWYLMLGRFALWAVAAGLTFILVWPAMWVDPVGSLSRIACEVLGFAATNRVTFFMGQVVGDPGAAFYPWIVLLRTTPVTLIGLVLAVPVLISRQPGSSAERPVAWVCLAWAVLFTLVLSSGKLKYDRYLLPIFPTLDILAALGWLWLLRRMPALPAIRSTQYGFLALLFVVQAVTLAVYSPYYLSYFNPLVGGGPVASRTIRLGWGEGLDQAADYLNGKPEAGDLQVATASLTIFAPLFHGQTVGLRDKDLRSANYVVVYVDDAQIGEPKAITRFYGAREPEHVVRLHGINYAWIYRNDAAQ